MSTSVFDFSTDYSSVDLVNETVFEQDYPNPTNYCNAIKVYKQINTVKPVLSYRYGYQFMGINSMGVVHRGMVVNIPDKHLNERRMTRYIIIVIDIIVTVYYLLNKPPTNEMSKGIKT